MLGTQATRTSKLEVSYARAHTNIHSLSAPHTHNLHTTIHLTALVCIHKLAGFMLYFCLVGKSGPHSNKNARTNTYTSSQAHTHRDLYAYAYTSKRSNSDK